MIIDQTYFHGRTALPHLTDVDGVASSHFTEEVEALNAFIETYEPEFLQKVLGRDMYKDYVANKTAERWVSFIEQLIDTDTKESPIADYVFWYRWQDIRTNGGISTDVVQDKETLPFTLRSGNAWNHLAEWMPEVFEWMEDNSTTYETGELSFDRTYWASFCSHFNQFGI